MIAIAWKILKGMIWKDNRLNPVGTFLTLAVAGYTAFLANNAYQRHVGASRLAVKIEQKAKENAKRSDDVRSKSLAGAGRVRDPHQRVD